MVSSGESNIIHRRGIIFTNIDEQLLNKVARLLAAGTPWIGLPRATSQVVSALYLHKCEHGGPLGQQEICDITHLSSSTVSMILSQLEAIGIVDRFIDNSYKSKGRRRLLFYLEMELNDLLYRGIKKVRAELQRILGDLHDFKQETSPSKNESTHLAIEKIERDVEIFLSTIQIEADKIN